MRRGPIIGNWAFRGGFLRQTLKENRSAVLREFFLPALLQGLLLAAVILAFVLLIAGDSNGAPLVGTVRDVAEHRADPNLVRLLYLIFGLVTAPFLAVRADRAASRGCDTAGFWWGIAGGVLLWQVLGECAWHFTVTTTSGLLHFPRIEGADGTALLLFFAALLLLLAAAKRIDFGMMIFFCAFLSNWIGHYFLLVSYDLFGQAFAAADWYRISGCIFGIPLLLFSLYCGMIAARDRRARLFSSLLLYTAVGILGIGFAGV